VSTSRLGYWKDLTTDVFIAAAEDFKLKVDIHRSPRSSLAKARKTCFDI